MKLAHGLDYFAFDPKGLRCLDVGASTGGFTDCLLQRGAVGVTAVDVGYGQLDWKLRNDPRVNVVERTNARYLDPALVEGPVEAAVCDVSFISLTLILPPLLDLLLDGGWLAALVKPQFEVGRDKVGKGGVVRDPVFRAEAVEKISSFLEMSGMTVLGAVPSPIKGPKGNQEFIVGARK